MSVIKNLRGLSNMEFYKNAIVLRRDLTSWMLRDFGTTRNKKSIQSVIKNIDESDKAVIENIFGKLGLCLNKKKTQIIKMSKGLTFLGRKGRLNDKCCNYRGGDIPSSI